MAEGVTGLRLNYHLDYYGAPFISSARDAESNMLQAVCRSASK
ncbi:hypothetical protein [Parasphingorhabdus sp.]